MKLRIRRNSLRFRLGRSEVKNLARRGRIEEKVNFNPLNQNDFFYKLEKTSANEFSATFTGGCVTVSVPDVLIDGWAATDQVSIEGSQKLDERTDLKFLIEKDFVCLNAHNDEDQSDRYPHPKGDEAC
ncbi:hypothetical protein BH10ACI3_BH10ACI3_02680 [soil metagenome]